MMVPCCLVAFAQKAFGRATEAEVAQRLLNGRCFRSLPLQWLSRALHQLTDDGLLAAADSQPSQPQAPGVFHLRSVKRDGSIG